MKRNLHLNPRRYKYHCILAKNKYNEDLFHEKCCDTFKKHVDKDGPWRDRTTNTYIIVSCNDERDFLEAHEKFSAYVPHFYPKEITDIVPDPLNMTPKQGRLLGRSDFFIDRHAPIKVMDK